MLGACIAVIFIVVTGFAARGAMRVLSGSDAKIRTLKSTLADQEMWMEEAPATAAKDRWLNDNMPRKGGLSLGKLQGDLIQSLQDDVLNRKLRINRQSLQEVIQGSFYTEVAVRLEIVGEEAIILEWLTTLQNPEKFLVVKELELKLDTRSRQIEPQGICDITIARWLHPDSTGSATPADSGTPMDTDTPSETGTTVESSALPVAPQTTPDTTQTAPVESTTERAAPSSPADPQ